MCTECRMLLDYIKFSLHIVCNDAFTEGNTHTKHEDVTHAVICVLCEVETNIL